MKLFPKLLLGACILLLSIWPHAALAVPDTLRISLAEAEAQFLTKNLQLLAQHYNVEADKALSQQAKTWDNPVLNTDQNVYSNHRFFEHGSDAAEVGMPKGQYFIQMQQLIRTAGKRGKLMSLANTNTAISQAQYADVLRNLKYALRNDYYSITQAIGLQRLLTEQQGQLDKLLTGMKAQLDAGNIARKDYLRIQALQVSLEQEVLENSRRLGDAEAELRTLLGLASEAFILPATAYQAPQLPTESLDSLVALAHKTNPVYLAQQYRVAYQHTNIAYQKALAVPDITVGPEYDHNSNYTPHYVGLSLNMPLPLLNRNKGNIRAATYQEQGEEAGLNEAELLLRNNIQNAVNKLRAVLQLVNSGQEDFFENYSRLYANVLESYRQRQISLLEFTDYFAAYKDIRQKQLQLELSLQEAKEELNYQVGADVLR